MALLMENGSEPLIESEKADLDAISALKESTALELKEKGNDYVKMGKKHYSDAIDCYTRSINQNVLCESEASTLFANRAHVNLLLGNYRRALTDSEEALKLYPTNIKALYRATRAAMSLNLLTEAKSYSETGLKYDPNNQELKKLSKQIDYLKSEQEQHEAQISMAVKGAKKLASSIEDRGLKIGKAMYQELTGLRKPLLDKSNVLHWPVLLLYAEVMSSDFIEDFCETDMFSAHLDKMFSDDSSPLPWDIENKYTRKDIELYYEAGYVACLSKEKCIRYLLEGTAGSKLTDVDHEDNDPIESSNQGFSVENKSTKWIKVNENRTLQDVLKKPDFIIQGIPVFYVVSRGSRFYNDFKSGIWMPPV